MPTKKRPKPSALVLLSRWRVNLGFGIGIAALLLAGHPTTRSILTWLPLALCGLGIRLWARGHLELRTPLAHSGPYALVRHPLYVGSFLLGLAFTLMMDDVRVSLVYAAGFLLMYVPKAIREERYLRELHGPAYGEYASRVGAVFPWPASVRARGAVATSFAWRRVLRHREWETWLGAAAACAVMWIRALWFAS